MLQFGGKDSKRHFTVVMGNKEHGLYVSSSPSSAAKKAVTKLCTANKSKKVEFHIREITQGSKKKTYGPYSGYIEKLKEPIELKGRVIKYKPIAKLSGKDSKKKMKGGDEKKPERVYTFNDLGNSVGNMPLSFSNLQTNATEKRKIANQLNIKSKELRVLATQKRKIANQLNIKSKELRVLATQKRKNANNIMGKNTSKLANSVTDNSALATVANAVPANAVLANAVPANAVLANAVPANAVLANAANTSLNGKSKN
jgi:hypothetical protein